MPRLFQFCDDAVQHKFFKYFLAVRLLLAPVPQVFSSVAFVVVGAFLDVFNIYDKFVLWAGGGALVPITSFGHLLIHGAMDTVNNFGVMGLFMGMFDLTSSGIVFVLLKIQR